MANFKIKKATIKDSSIILELIKGIARYEKLEDEVENTEKKIKSILFGKKRYAKVILGYENNIPIGFALYFFNYSTFTGKPGLYLEDLFVKEEFRSKGYGKALIMHLIQTAYKKNCGRMEWVVLNWNKPAIDFYNSLGAKPMDQWTIYRLNEQTIELINK